MSILPTPNSNSTSNFITLGQSGILGTTTGLVKRTNEDRIGYTSSNGTLRFCVADGHWGDGAADIIAKFWLDESTDFPEDREQAIKITSEVQSRLFKTFGKPIMDEDKDHTPEASFIAAEIHNGLLRIASYGDCRLLIVNQGSIVYEHNTLPTWLGAFSYLGLRSRLSVSTGLFYTEVKLAPDDTLMLFSDGVDECVYEAPTISNSELAELATNSTLEAAYDAIVNKVLEHGAEDNASIALYKTPSNLL